MKHVLAAPALALVLALSACGSYTTTTDTPPTAAASSAAPVEEAPAEEPPAEEAPVEEAPVDLGSTCDQVREAILTGSQADINAAMKALQADKSADSTAREYARYYLGRDKNDPQLREMDISLIQMSCS